jgi:hypothetical protein
VVRAEGLYVIPLAGITLLMMGGVESTSITMLRQIGYTVKADRNRITPIMANGYFLIAPNFILEFS